MEQQTVEQRGTLRLGAIGQVQLLTKDVEAARAFYEDVLRMRHLYTFGDLTFFDCDGTRLFIRQVRGEELWRPGSLLYFRVDDIHDAYRTLVERGVEFREAPGLVHRHADTGIEEWMAFFEDPDGNTLALMSQLDPRSDSSP